MKRRKALKTISAGITAGLAIPVWLSSCKDDDIRPEVEYDGTVAIIGAGAAGLYAADSLRTKGVKVKVFEASDRIGGRIRSLALTDNSLIETDFPIELGAERILGTDSIWARFITELNVPVTELSSLSTNGYIIDKLFKTNQNAQADPDFVAAKGFYENLSALAGRSGSVQESIETAGLSSGMYPILNSWIGNKYGTDNSRLGVDAAASVLATRTRDNSELLLSGNSMESVLLSRFNHILPSVELNTVIKKIDYSSGKIQLTGEKKSEAGNIESFTAEVDKVVVAVPVSAINTGEIVFVPSLPEEKLNSLSLLGMDPSIRVVLDFKQNFWGSDVGFIYGGENSPEFLSTGIGRSDFNKTLSITINGPKAELLSLKGDGMINDILAELDHAFEGKASKNIRRDEADNIIYAIKDWSKDPYVKGGISYVKPGGSLLDREQVAASVQSVLFFAGEATHASDPGTINGALLSAERVVVEVVKSIVGA